MNEANDLIERAAGMLAEVARVRSAALDDETLCLLMANVEQVGRLVDGVRALLAGEVEERSRYEFGSSGLAQRLGHSRAAHLIEHVTRVSQAEAVQRIRLGAAIRPGATFDGQELPAAFPRVAAEILNGRVGADAATGIIRCLTQASHTANLDDLDRAEAALVETATMESADLVAVKARVWREVLDPDGAEPRDAEVRERRRFTMGRERDGIAVCTIAAESTVAALLRAAFSERSGPGVKPRFLDSDDTARGVETITTPDGDIIENLRDPRTREQRQYDIFAGLLTAGLRATESQPGSMRSTTTVMAVIQLRDLENGHGVGWLNDVDESVSAATIRELACDSGYQKIVLGAHGEVLHLGIRERFFSTAQRKALAVRDGGCVWPHCTAPPSWCQAHHVIEYQSGGRTDIDNGVLLCSAHHHMLHASAFTMKMVHGKPRLLAPPWLDPDQMWKPLGRSRVSMVA
jgi:hypothetical protein